MIWFASIMINVQLNPVQNVYTKMMMKDEKMDKQIHIIPKYKIVQQNRVIY